MEGRAYRKQNVERAYDVQMRAGLEGAARYTSIGVGLAILAHYTWPAFRRQTLAFKGFLVTGFTVFGLCTYAESALQKLETEQRRVDSLIRKEARIDLQKRGIVPTETAIAQWRTEHLKRMAENEDTRSSAS